MDENDLCQFQAWILKISCAICHTILSQKLAIWMDEVVDSKETLGGSGATQGGRGQPEGMLFRLSSLQLKGII